MKSKLTCRHIKGDFIGFQIHPFKNRKIALYNCAKCHSTFALTDESECPEPDYSRVDVLNAPFRLQEAG